MEVICYIKNEWLWFFLFEKTKFTCSIEEFPSPPVRREKTSVKSQIVKYSWLKGMLLLNAVLKENVSLIQFSSTV